MMRKILVLQECSAHSPCYANLWTALGTAAWCRFDFALFYKFLPGKQSGIAGRDSVGVD
jgi:hypothetical protein